MLKALLLGPGEPGLAREALPLAETFLCVKWSHAGPAHPSVDRQRCHHPHFTDQEAEAQRD